MDSIETEFLNGRAELFAAAAVAAVALVLVALVIRSLRKRRTSPATESADLKIEVASLQLPSPAKDAPRMDFYSTQVQLAVIVVAPVGRNRSQLALEDLPAIIESLQPNMMRVVNAHKPKVRRWPAQLSAQGFTQAFFNNIVLPGNRGKGTPWCSVAGKIAKDDEQFLVGIACRGAKANSLGQVVIQHEGQWLDVLRVHPA